MTLRDLRAQFAMYIARAPALLASQQFWYFVVGLLIVQAVWFICSARYPMAFDENFHFGVIQLHAQQWLPFFTGQPDHVEQFGGLARDPSYLYHFLMSIPYRAVAAVTNNTVAQIITLRLINAGLFVVDLILFRRLLLRLGGGRALVHTSLCIFVLVPIVPFLAAHINYDNLFILAVILSLQLTFTWIDDLRQNKVSFVRSGLLLCMLGLASLVKYAFLPITVTLLVVMCWQLVAQRHHMLAIKRGFIRTCRQSSRIAILGTILLLGATTGLIFERYGLNLVRYHSLNPSCEQVLSVKECLAYGPWARDYLLEHAATRPTDINPLAYFWHWPAGIWFRSFFAISDTYDTQSPLPLPGVITIVIGIIGLILSIRLGGRLLRDNLYRQITLAAMTFYLAALISETFKGYLRTGAPVAINGRYLVPFLPAIILFVGMAYQEALRRRPQLKPVAVCAVLLLFLQGGGVMTFIIRSKDVWFWPNPTVVQINHLARDVLEDTVIGARTKLFGY